MTGTGLRATRRAEGIFTDNARHVLGQELKAARRDAGMTCAGLGALIGRAQATVSKMENGVLRASVEDVRAICDVLKLDGATGNRLLKLARSVEAEVGQKRVVVHRGRTPASARVWAEVAEADLLRIVAVGALPEMGPGKTGQRVAVVVPWGFGAASVDAQRGVARMEKMPDVAVYKAPPGSRAQWPQCGFTVVDEVAVLLWTTIGLAISTAPVDVRAHLDRFEDLVVRCEGAGYAG